MSKNLSYCGANIYNYCEQNVIIGQKKNAENNLIVLKKNLIIEQKKQIAEKTIINLLEFTIILQTIVIIV